MSPGVRVFLFLAAIGAGIQGSAAQSSMVEQLRSQWETSRRQMVQIAEAMPADKFGYRPVPDVRNFGEIITHVAGENMTWMETVAGVAKPGANERFEHLKERAEIVKALSDFYDYGTKVLAGLTDPKAMESIPFGNRGQTPRWVIVMQAIGHGKEHYGNLVTYMRLNGMVPPSTAGRQQRGGS